MHFNNSSINQISQEEIMKTFSIIMAVAILVLSYLYVEETKENKTLQTTVVSYKDSLNMSAIPPPIALHEHQNYLTFDSKSSKIWTHGDDTTMSLRMEKVLKGFFVNPFNKNMGASPLKFDQSAITMNVPTLMPVIRRILCNKTTEAGEDEIFVQFIYRGSDGSYSQGTIPTLPNHVSLNDGRGQRYTDNWNTVQDRFPLGKTGTLIINIFELDGGRLSDYMRIASGALNECGDPKCLAGKKIIDVAQRLNLDIIDSDDFIGSFSLEYGYPTNISGIPPGRLWKNHRNLDRAVLGESWGEYGYHMKFNGDGSEYEVWVELGR